MKEPMFEIKQKEKRGNYAKFIISPLERGYGDTLGNSLRRVLLTSLPGVAIISVKINGVKHQFSTLKGMKEDVVEFILNLKKVRFTALEGTTKEGKPLKATLSGKGPGEVKAKDIKLDASLEVANPDLVLANLAKGAKLEAKIQIEHGAGWESAEEKESKELGLLPLDSHFSPIARVNYKVEETRVGRLTNYDKLILEVWTDGTISPKDAVLEAAKILVSYFNQVVTPKKVKKPSVQVKEDTLGSVGNLSVEEIGLPTRVANALVKAGYETVEKLASAKREKLVKVRNLGEKSVKIIDAALGEKDVKLKD